MDIPNSGNTNNTSGVHTVGRDYRKVFVALIVCVSLLAITVTAFLVIFAPLTRTSDLHVVVEGDFEPIVYGGIVQHERVYFIIEKRGRSGPLVVRQGIGVSVPSGRMWSLLGLYFWERKRSFGVPITSPKMDVQSRIMWDDKQVQFEYHGSQFRLSFY